MTSRTNKHPTRRKRSSSGKILLCVIVIGIVLALAVLLAFRLSPWPSALFVRHIFDKQAVIFNQALEKHVPTGIMTLENVQYLPEDKDARFDAYYPAAAADSGKKLPVIIWIHGGGFISGNKEQVSNYCKILSAKGYAVIAIDYSVAPESKYPVPVRQANAALAYLVEHGDRFMADTSQFFLAGDSGGALIAAQVANLIASDDYARTMDMAPSVRRSQLKGLLLFCGIYDAAHINLDGDFGSFLRTVLWSYSGTKDFQQDANFKTVSVINYITRGFPPSFITAGNGDALLSQSEAFARKLGEFQVKADTLFYPEEHIPRLPHEYQFNLDNKEGELALERSVSFLRSLGTGGKEGQ